MCIKKNMQQSNILYKDKETIYLYNQSSIHNAL